MCVMKTPCEQCPFRKNALPGWLGPYENAQELLNVINGEIHFMCHMTLGADDEEVDETKMKYCKGALLFMINNGKMPRDRKLAELRNKAKGEDLSNILDVPGFMYRHDPNNKVKLIRDEAKNRKLSGENQEE